MSVSQKKYLERLAISLLCILSFSESVYAESISSTPSISETVPNSNEYYPKKTIWPNRAAKSLTIPTGWGASWGDVFFGGGITKPAAYTTKSDAAVAFGMGLGNPVKNIGIEIVPTGWDVSKFDNFALDLKIHHILNNTSSIAIGGENLFADPKKTDRGQTYYIVFSHVFQGVHTDDPNISAFHGTIGFGSGRFVEKSPLDIQSGKGKNGTYVFGALAYQIYDSTNFIIDWNGLNLSTGFGLAPFHSIPVGFILGVTDIARYSGDRVRLIASLGYGIQF